MQAKSMIYSFTFHFCQTDYKAAYRSGIPWIVPAFLPPSRRSGWDTKRPAIFLNTTMKAASEVKVIHKFRPDVYDISSYFLACGLVASARMSTTSARP